MDYKLNILTSQIECDEMLVPEIPPLHFGTISESTIVFDFDRFMEESQTNNINFRTFIRANKRYIDLLAKHAGKSTSELFFQNTDGHILIASELAYLFLSYIDDDVFLYFNSMLHDVMTNGVAYSNLFLFEMASTRMPSDIMKEIIKGRENDTTGDE